MGEGISPPFCASGSQASRNRELFAATLMRIAHLRGAAYDWCGQGPRDSMTASGTPEPWELEFLRIRNGREPCREFIDDLTPVKRLALGAALANVLSRQGPNVCNTEFGRDLGENLCEFRIKMSERDVLRRVWPQLAGSLSEASTTDQVLIRVFFHPFRERIVLLAAAYDNGIDSTFQSRAKGIRHARRQVKRWNRTRRNQAVLDQCIGWGVQVLRSVKAQWRVGRSGSGLIAVSPSPRKEIQATTATIAMGSRLRDYLIAVQFGATDDERDLDGSEMSI
jgi:hypothetical protein